MKKQDTEARYRSLSDNSGGGLTITEIQDDGTPVRSIEGGGMLRLTHTTGVQRNAHHSKSICARVYTDDANTARAVDRADAAVVPIIAVSANAFCRGRTDEPCRPHERISCKVGGTAADISRFGGVNEERGRQK